MPYRFTIYLLVFLLYACVDRVIFDVGDPGLLGIAIDGQITNEPGPYYVRIASAFDTESANPIRKKIPVQGVKLFDNEGNTETLHPFFGTDTWHTSPYGMQGVPGRAYRIEVELENGTIIRSKPDTLFVGGTVDSVFFKFRQGQDRFTLKSTYGFDIYFNSTTAFSRSQYFLWNFTGTFKVTTHPQYFRTACPQIAPDCDNPNIPCGCPFPLPCSGYVLDRLTQAISYTGRPCTCCDCWVDVYNDKPIVNSLEKIQNGKFLNVHATYVALTPYNFMYKFRAEIQQVNISRRAFLFWKGIDDQQNGVNSIFQPVTGKLPENFEVIGENPGPVYGLFYASGVKSKSTYIQRRDIPNENVIPQDVPYKYVNKVDFGSCLDFPYSTTIKPAYWKD